MVSADDVLFVINELNRDLPWWSRIPSRPISTLAPPPRLWPAGSRVNETTQYTTELGYGWHTGSVRSVDRGTSDSLTRDFNATSDGTFVVAVPRGTYRVDLIFGDRGTACAR